MNVVKLMGGLGNQLFQYAFGRVLQQNEKKVAYDNEWYSRRSNSHRPFLLDKFKLSNLNIHSFIPTNSTIREKGYDIQLFHLEGNYNFWGYWQYANYYRAMRMRLRREFVLKEKYVTKEFEDWKDKIMNSESVGVHVRRGDYLKLENWVLPTSYYFEAINVAPEGPLFVFSDDIEWCKHTFKPEYFTREIYFVHLEPHLDFGLLRYCQHIILSSSTFSWWPAFLNKKGKVIRPTKWLGEKERAEVMCLEKWVRVC